MILVLLVIGFGLIIFCFKYNIGFKEKYVPTAFDKHTVYWKVRNHLLAQGAKAFDAGGEQCAYRAKGGLKCAIGCLIPDSLYRKDLEGKTVYDIGIQNLLEKVFGHPLDAETQGFLQDLQGVHDHHPVDAWKTQLNRVANDHSVYIPCSQL